MVTLRAPHIFNIVGADTFLRGGRPGGGGLLLPQEDRFERQHSGDRQQHRRVFRHQGGTWQPLVALALVKAQEFFANIGAGQGSWGRHGDKTGG